MLSALAVDIFILGVLIGIVLGATGAGGAILSVPLLTFVLHLTVSQAAPTSLFSVAIAASVAALIGLREGVVRYKAALLMAGVGLCFTPLGLWLAQRVPNTPLVILFAIVLVLVAWRMWRSVNAQSAEVAAKDTVNAVANVNIATNAVISQEKTIPAFVCERSDVSGKFIWTLPCARSLAMTGSVAGFLSGLIGVGGGFIIVPALKKYSNLKMREIVATSLAVIALVSSFSVVLAASHGLMNWGIALPFATGTVTGMLGGQWIARRISSAVLAKGFAGLALLAAVSMLFKLV